MTSSSIPIALSNDSLAPSSSAAAAAVGVGSTASKAVAGAGVAASKSASSAIAALTWKQHIVIGGLARGTATLSMFPVDTMKTRLQMGATNGMHSVLKPPYFAGYGAAICSQIPYGMVVFGTYETAKTALIEKFPGAPKLGLYLSAAVLGDLMGSLVLTPGEIVKQQTQAGLYKTNTDALRGILARRGARGLYQGYFGLVARDLPFRALQLPMYEQFKDFFAARYTNGVVDDIRPHQAACIGAAAGMISAGLTNPVDVIKTQMMVGKGDASVLQVVRNVHTARGILGFAAGAPQRMGFLGGSSAVFFIVYEFARGTMQDGSLSWTVEMMG